MQDPAQERSESARVGARLEAILADQPAGIVLGYVPIRGELDPIFAITSAIKRDWAVAVLRCTSKDGVPLLQALPADAIEAAPDGPVWDTRVLEPDAWGMLAPRAKVPVRAQSIAVALIPGLAFDRAGHRLGRGAGVYDRLLATLPSSVVRVGVTVADRVVPELPHEAHDVCMHVLATPDEIVRCNR
ncbi:MAG: 5-formyltetrahydrofolate cyclo-ligase [Phycisphaerae bacterium]|nr:5-formyltetrahydrofolate cyclo-ligase [Phycisphaerae bacterium]